MFNFPKCPLPPGSQVWAYLRDSGGDGQDLSSQRAYVLGYCEHHHLGLSRLFEDAAISGGSTLKREEFELMIELARRAETQEVAGLLYWDTKRFARNQLDSQFYKSDLRRRGYILVSLSDDIPDNEFAIVFEAFLEWKAQKDRQDIAKDVRRGMQYLVSLKGSQGNYLGLFPGAAPTFFKGERFNLTELNGIRRNDGRSRIAQRLVPDPDTWPLGQRAWAMRAERASYAEIEAALHLFPKSNAAGGTYAHIFRNEIYIGKLNYGGQVYNDFVPALATPEQWAAVQALNYQRPARGSLFPVGKKHPKAGRGDFLLSGMCTCLYCQAKMHGSTNRRPERQTEWRYYICATKDKHPEECPHSKRLSANQIERIILEAVVSQILTIDFAVTMTDRINAIINNTDLVKQEIKRRQKQLASLDAAISNLLDMAEAHPSADVLNRLTQRENERKEAQLETDHLHRRLRNSQITVNRQALIDLLLNEKNTLMNGEVKAQQLVLDKIITGIELGRDRGRLHYRFPLSAVYLERVRGFELNLTLNLELSFA